MHTVTVTPEDVSKIAKQANLKLRDDEVNLFAEQFTKTIEVINHLNELDTSKIKATYQVNGLSNITREDEVDLSRVLSQKTALSEAKATHKGFFVVERIIDRDVEDQV
jgi:aspartyl-tRNA(Asn)/glutamyl-tRNA(Gln) amidotransferase subunit C